MKRKIPRYKWAIFVGKGTEYLYYGMTGNIIDWNLMNRTILFRADGRQWHSRVDVNDIYIPQ